MIDAMMAQVGNVLAMPTFLAGFTKEKAADFIDTLPGPPSSEDILNLILDLLFIPLQLILAPLDFLLERIDGIEIIAQSILWLANAVGTIPSTIVYLMGVSPIIWNGLFITYIAYMTVSPAINAIKTFWAWVRP